MRFPFRSPSSSELIQNNIRDGPLAGAPAHKHRWSESRVPRSNRCAGSSASDGCNRRGSQLIGHYKKDVLDGSLRSRSPLSRFTVIAFSLPFSLSFAPHRAPGKHQLTSYFVQQWADTIAFEPIIETPLVQIPNAKFASRLGHPRPQSL
jgi:hypothetical protein